MTVRNAIDELLSGKRIALVGLSSQPADVSRAVFHALVARGFDVVPVNPRLTEVEGRLQRVAS